MNMRLKSITEDMCHFEGRGGSVSVLRSAVQQALTEVGIAESLSFDHPLVVDYSNVHPYRSLPHGTIIVGVQWLLIEAAKLRGDPSKGVVLGLRPFTKEDTNAASV